MRISVKSEYALLAIFDLSLQPPDTLVRVSEIASRQNVPLRFLEAILNELKQKGFVTAKRGNHGGYSLATPSNEISVGQILSCMGERKPQKPGGLSELWLKLDASVWKILNETTFADLANFARLREHGADPEGDVAHSQLILRKDPSNGGALYG